MGIIVIVYNVMFLCQLTFDIHEILLFRFIIAGDANRQISDLKFKLAKSEQEVAALEQNVGSRNEQKKMTDSYKYNSIIFSVPSFFLSFTDHSTGGAGDALQNGL